MRRYPIMQLNSTKKAEAWATRNYPQVRWNLTGVDPRLLRPTFRQLSTMFCEFPSVLDGHLISVSVDRGRYRDLSTEDFDGLEWAFCCSYPSGECEMLLNIDYYSDVHRLAKLLDGASKPPGCSGLDYPVAHECGHVVYHLHRCEVGEIALREAGPRGAHTSLQARQNESELFAETYASYYSSPSPTPYAVRLIEAARRAADLRRIT